MKRVQLFVMLAVMILGCTLSTPTATEWIAGSTDTNAVPPTVGITPEAETPAPVKTDVWVFYTMADDSNMTPVPVARSVGQGDMGQVGLLRNALEELLKGPTEAEKAAGLISWFSVETADTLTGVGQSGGNFDADFTGWNTLIPNASTSAGSQMLLSQLNSTVFQFDFVQSIAYSLDGDCDAFWQWLQMGCHPVTRAEWEAG
jgi:hypothetical protein